MSKYFNTFPELFVYRKNCPICSKELAFKIETHTFAQTGRAKKLIGQLENYFTGMLTESGEGKKISINIKSISEPIEIPELKLIMDFNRNKCLANDLECAIDLFSIKLYCKHKIIGNEYEAAGSFGINIDVDETGIAREKDKFLLELENIHLDYEKYKICNLFLEDEKPNGNLITITNDYIIKKTSFSIAESNLDGTLANFKQKRIDLADDDFFKFDNPKKILSRINAIFLLQ
jgi:hypothetical protein